MSQVAVQQEFDLGPFLRREERIDTHEGEAILERWEFGRDLLRQRHGGKQLPNGLLGQLAEATGKSERELRYRVQFAERYGTEVEVCNAVADFKSWHAIVNEALPTTAERLVASTENEWYTPRPYIDAARAALGGIDLDPASSETANATVDARTFYTAHDDGLTQRWTGRVWLNPPYGRLAGDFVARLVVGFDAGEVEAAVALVNAHATDTGWFQPLWDHTLCFTDERIDFDSAGRVKDTTSTHGSVFAYLGPNPERFAAEFSQFGVIVRRWP